MRLFKSGHKLRLAGAVAKAVAIINTSNGGSIQTLLQLSSHSHLQREGKTVVGHGCSMGDVGAAVSPNFATKILGVFAVEPGHCFILIIFTRK